MIFAISRAISLANSLRFIDTNLACACLAGQQNCRDCPFHQFRSRWSVLDNRYARMFGPASYGYFISSASLTTIFEGIPYQGYELSLLPA